MIDCRPCKAIFATHNHRSYRRSAETHRHRVVAKTSGAESDRQPALKLTDKATQAVMRLRHSRAGGRGGKSGSLIAVQFVRPPAGGVRCRSILNTTMMVC